MKRALNSFVAILFSLCCLINTAAAFNGTEERIDYEDGSYAIITIENDGLTRAATADSKTYTFYNSSNQRCFSYTLYATFTYDGTTSHAESSAGSAGLYLTGWSLATHNEFTSGNVAYGNASFASPTGTLYPVSLSLTCDKDGNVK